MLKIFVYLLIILIIQVYYLVKKKPELELIPVYLDNMNRILPKGVFLPAPLLSRVLFGAPIWYERNESKDAFLERARNSVLALKDFRNREENRQTSSSGE